MIGIGEQISTRSDVRDDRNRRTLPHKNVMVAIDQLNANMAGDAKRVYKAMLKVPFICVADLFMTPTAVACADLVLPVQASPERDSMRAWWRPYRTLKKVIEADSEVKGDEELILELGKRLNPKMFPWDNIKEMYDWALAKADRGLTFDKMTEMSLVAKTEYRKYERHAAPGWETWIQHRHRASRAIPHHV